MNEKIKDAFSCLSGSVASGMHNGCIDSFDGSLVSKSNHPYSELSWYLDIFPLVQLSERVPISSPLSYLSVNTQKAD